MLSQPPFDKLPIETGETVLWAETQSTFHRSVDLSGAISDRALYLYRRPSFKRGRWLRFPLDTIKQATISPFSGDIWKALLLAPVFASIAIGNYLHDRHPWIALVPGVFGIFVVFITLKSLTDRTLLVLDWTEGQFRFISPADDKKNEKRHDRRFLRMMIAELRSRGIAVDDNCPPTPDQALAPNSPDDGPRA